LREFEKEGRKINRRDRKGERKERRGEPNSNSGRKIQITKTKTKQNKIQAASWGSSLSQSGLLPWIF
jgi:hypothetical protein